MIELILKPGELTLKELRDVYFNSVGLSIEDSTWVVIENAQALVRSKVVGGDIVYGVNTGFGLLASKHIEEELLSKLQHNLILSHATGVGVIHKNITLEQQKKCVSYTQLFRVRVITL